MSTKTGPPQKCIEHISGQPESDPSLTIDKHISLLLKRLREMRCLLVLDNMEAILRSGDHTGQFRAGYEAYNQFLIRLSADPHQSCLVITGREKPAELTQLEEETPLVQSLRLTGLSQRESQAILKDSGLVHARETWTALIERYGGNPLASELTSGVIREEFGGDVSRFLEEETLILGGIQGVLD